MGLLDKDVSKELQLKAELTLADAISTARQAEHVISQMSSRPGNSTTVEEVKKGGQRPKGSARSVRGRGRGSRPHVHRKPEYDSDSESEEEACKSCNGDHPSDRKLCPARSVRCYDCGKKGHYASCCPGSRSKGRPGSKSKGHKELQEIEISDEESEVYFVGEVSCVVDNSENVRTIEMYFSDYEWDEDQCVNFTGIERVVSHVQCVCSRSGDLIVPEGLSDSVMDSVGALDSDESICVESVVPSGKDEDSAIDSIVELYSDESIYVPSGKSVDSVMDSIGALDSDESICVESNVPSGKGVDSNREECPDSVREDYSAAYSFEGKGAVESNGLKVKVSQTDGTVMSEMCGEVATCEDFKSMEVTDTSIKNCSVYNCDSVCRHRQLSDTSLHREIQGSPGSPEVPKRSVFKGCAVPPSPTRPPDVVT